MAAPDERMVPLTLDVLCQWMQLYEHTDEVIWAMAVPVTNGWLENPSFARTVQSLTSPPQHIALSPDTEWSYFQPISAECENYEEERYVRVNSNLFTASKATDCHELILTERLTPTPHLTTEAPFQAKTSEAAATLTLFVVPYFIEQVVQPPWQPPK